MPVRKVSNRGGNIIGRFPSIKMGRMIAFESLIERDLVYLLDYDADVEWFEEQPLTITYQYEDKLRHYTPDFRLIERGQNILVECKPAIFVETDENQRKFTVAEEWCREQQWTFRIVTDRDVRSGFLLENIKLLTRYARQAVDSVTYRRIQTLLHSSQRPMRIADLAKMLSPNEPDVAISAILHLAFHHGVCLSIEEYPLSGETLVHGDHSAEKEGMK